MPESAERDTAPAEARGGSEDAGAVDPSQGLKPLPYKPGMIERAAVSFLKKRASALPVLTAAAALDDPVHVLTALERQRVNSIVRRTVIGSLLAGVFSALAMVALDLELEEEEPTRRYLLLGIVGAATTILEVLFLYRAHLYAVVDLARATGATSLLQDTTLGETLPEAMARAALELPDPVRVIEGIDPQRGSSRLGLALAVLAYKAKRGLTTFLMKTLIRRVGARDLLRTLAPTVALPISGAWNALVSYKILREVRMRVLGPSAVIEMKELLLSKVAPLSGAGRISLLRAIGVAMVRKRAAHPNLLALLRAFAGKIGAVRALDLDSSALFLAGLPRLSQEEQRLSLKVLQVACVLDGGLSRRERSYLEKARVACGLSPDLSAVTALLRSFSRGDPIDPQALEALA